MKPPVLYGFELVSSGKRRDTAEPPQPPSLPPAYLGITPAAWHRERAELREIGQLARQGSQPSMVEIRREALRAIHGQQLGDLVLAASRPLDLSTPPTRRAPDAELERRIAELVAADRRVWVERRARQAAARKARKERTLAAARRVRGSLSARLRPNTKHASTPSRVAAAAPITPAWGGRVRVRLSGGRQ